MPRSLRNSLIAISITVIAPILAMGQGWTADTSGLYSSEFAGHDFQVKFKTNGPMGKDWMYGGYLDKDSLRRCVAYREGGRWVPIPFSGYYGNEANDIAMYGDTLLIGGDFGQIRLDKDSSTLPNCGLLKWYNDSLWADTTIYGPVDLASAGDSLLIWGDSYYNPPDIVFTQFMTTDGGATWQYPYSTVHPTESTADFGPDKRLEILDNGDILTVNNGSPLGNPYRGISRWDGQQWHAYGQGLVGSGYVNVLDFEFYKGELHMAGTFGKYITYYGDTIGYFPQNPGNAIVRWDGNQWHQLATGILEGGADDIFVHKGILYCSTFSGNPDFHQYGDAFIPNLAGWDGQQWCGTPANWQTHPDEFGIINDTLFVSFTRPGVINGDTVGHLAYFDGDYVNGPDAICSTPGLGEEEAVLSAAGLEIYPNPAGDEVHLSLESTPIRQLRLYDLSGRLVQERQWSQPVYNTVLEIPGLRPGVYLVEVNGNAQHRLVKQ